MNKILLSKIILVLILSFFLSSLLIENVYIGYTPVIRKNLSNELIAKINAIFKNKNKIQNIIPEKNLNLSFYEKINKNLFTPISKGVYAQPLEKGGEYILIKNEEIDWVEYTIVIKGKELKIKVPKGEKPPDQKMLERIYK